MFIVQEMKGNEMVNQVMKFREYHVRQVWCKSQRWKTRRLYSTRDPEFLKLKSNRDIYCSIRRYHEDILENPQRDLIDCDCVSSLFFDIDGHRTEVTSRMLVQSTYYLCQFLKKELDLSDDELFCWWTGRGFHLAVPAEALFDEPNNSPELYFKGFADFIRRSIKLYCTIKIWDSIENTSKFQNIDLLDSSIYHRSALIRIPGSLNSNSRFSKGLPKVRVPLIMLNKLYQQRESADFLQKVELITRYPMASDMEWI